MYSFKHALTQDVVYAGVLERRRRQHHAAAGRGLEELYAGRIDDVVELVAYHYGRSPEGEKAVDYAILAGAKAQRRWANTEALAFFEDALKRLATMPDTEANRLRKIDAVVKQAETMFALGRHAEHIKTLEAIREIVEASADSPRRAEWYYWAGFLHSLTGASADVSIGYCRQASEIAEREGLDDLRAYAQCCLAHVYLVAGNLQDALKAGEWALEAFEAQGNLWWACRTLWALLPVTNALGDWERALVYCDRALTHATAMDDARLKVVAHLRRGATEVQRGDAARALEACRQAEALSPGPFDKAMLKAVRGQALIKGPDPAAGTAELEEAVAWFAKSNLRYTHSYAVLFLAEGYLRHGQCSKARALAEEAVVVARDRHYWHLEGVAERVLGESLLPDDRQAAKEHFEAAALILAEVGARNDLAKAWLTQATIRHAEGDHAGGLSLAGRALSLFEELGTLDEPERVRTWLASASAAE